MITPEQLAKSGTEHGEQMALFCWASDHIKLYPSLKWMHAIPNGGARGNDKKTAMIRGAALKAEGVKSGVADVFLPSTGVYAGLYIEMKRAKGVPSDVTDEQLDFARHVKRQGYEWIVAFGWIDAVLFIRAYLENRFLILTDKQIAVISKL